MARLPDSFDSCCLGPRPGSIHGPIKVHALPRACRSMVHRLDGRRAPKTSNHCCNSKNTDGTEAAKEAAVLPEPPANNSTAPSGGFRHMDSVLELSYALDTFYFLVCGALVMWMAAGFSMLESGLVRAKNTAEILTKNVGLYSIACIMY